jgi:hypothetical protein
VNIGLRFGGDSGGAGCGWHSSRGVKHDGKGASSAVAHRLRSLSRLPRRTPVHRRRWKEEPRRPRNVMNLVRLRCNTRKPR